MPMIPRDEAKDIRECYGVWEETNERTIWEDDGERYYKVIPYADEEEAEHVGLNIFDDRDDFEDAYKTCERIEPIPPQCVPGYEEPAQAPDWKANTVRRYPRVTEWD